MSNYRRAKVPGGTYFFTVNLLERRRRLLVEHIADLRAAFRLTHAARPFEVIAIVILPDHLHCLWRLPADDSDNANRWAQIKGGFSRRLPQGERRSVQRVCRRERGIWQRRYWEHLIRDDDDLRRHVDYIHFNPVKHGHVSRAVDWPHSSFGRWIAAGAYGADWGAGSPGGLEPALRDLEATRVMSARVGRNSQSGSAASVPKQAPPAANAPY